MWHLPYQRGSPPTHPNIQARQDLEAIDEGVLASFLGLDNELRNPEGPSTECLRTLVPRNIKGMVFRTRDLKYWELGPSGPPKTIPSMVAGTRVLQYSVLGPPWVAE